MLESYRLYVVRLLIVACGDSAGAAVGNETQ
jgi:hypothetical protein